MKTVVKKNVTITTTTVTHVDGKKIETVETVTSCGEGDEKDLAKARSAFDETKDIFRSIGKMFSDLGKE